MVLSAPSEIQPVSGSCLGRVSGLGGRDLCFQSVFLGAEAKAICFLLHSTALGSSRAMVRGGEVVKLDQASRRGRAQVLPDMTVQQLPPPGSWHALCLCGHPCQSPWKINRISAPLGYLCVLCYDKLCLSLSFHSSSLEGSSNPVTA